MENTCSGWNSRLWYAKMFNVKRRIDSSSHFINFIFSIAAIYRRGIKSNGRLIKALLEVMKLIDY